MQSRDEIAEQVVALAGSVSSEKAARMRELVGEARKEVACDLERRIVALERGRVAAPFGQIPQHAFERADENVGWRCDCGHSEEAHGEHGCTATLCGEPCGCGETPASEAQGEPPTIEECQSAYWLAHNAHESSDQPVLYAINAVRDLCLSRAPSPSPALAAIVEALDGYADLLETIAGGRIGHAPNRVYADLLFDVEAIKAKRDALDRARAALSAAAKAGGVCDHHFESNPGMFDTSHRYCTKCGRAE